MPIADEEAFSGAWPMPGEPSCGRSERSRWCCIGGTTNQRVHCASAWHDFLPFGCNAIPAACFRQIAAAWLGSPSAHGIPLEEFTEVDAALNDKIPEPQPRDLAVWSDSVAVTAP